MTGGVSFTIQTLFLTNPTSHKTLPSASRSLNPRHPFLELSLELFSLPGFQLIHFLRESSLTPTSKTTLYPRPDCYNKVPETRQHKQQKLIFHSSRGLGAGWSSGEGPLTGWQMATFSPCPHIVFPWVCVKRTLSSSSSH